ncbi:ABC transporter ATP-binding protein, partial [Staphylococcus pseudintermedius]
ELLSDLLKEYKILSITDKNNFIHNKFKEEDE